MPISCLAFLFAAIVAAPSTPSPKSVLPLQRLRLYETGVGYFERRGRLDRGGLALPVPTAHLDDALKTLVVLDGSEGAKVRGVAFSTAVSEGMARAIAGLPEESEGVQYVDLLRSLEGAKVIVSVDRRRIEGRLIDVEGPFADRPARRRDAQAEDEPVDPLPPQYRLLLLGSDGELRRIPTEDVASIRPAEPGAAARLDVAAEALSDHAVRNTQHLSVQMTGGGKLGLGYIAEAPVWRTSYRVVLGATPASGRLQGWALVHNDTDEDWHDVSIELANGRPASFLYPLAAPRYARRELVAPDEELSTVPQLAKTTPDRMWLDGEEIGDSYGAGGLGLVGVGRGGGGYGEGTIGDGTYGVDTHDAMGSMLGDLVELSQGNAEPQGALFVYRVGEPVDLAAHHSALLPIVAESVEAESITWFPRGELDGLTGVRLINSTAQTLPAGTVSFFAEGGFVGEALLDRLGPQERRFVLYGAELDVELERSAKRLGETTKALRFEQSSIVEHVVAKSKIRLAIENRSRREQRVYVGLDVPRRAKLYAGEDLELDFDVPRETALAVTRVAAGGSVEHEIVADTPLRRVHDAIDESTLTALLARDGITATAKGVLTQALEHRREADRMLLSAREISRDLADTEADLQRLRDDLTALGQARVRGRLRGKASRELLQKEEAIVALRRARREAKRDAAAATARVHATLKALE